jgi:hypothetical protein
MKTKKFLILDTNQINMRKLSLILIVLLSFVYAMAQNPFAEYGYIPKIATLSQGQYNEFFDNDTLVQIGSVLFNTKSKQIVAFIETDTLYSEATLEPDIVSRWISPDPLAEKYLSLSPYVYVTNNPVIKMDPDGRDGVVVIDKTNQILTVTANYYVNTQKVNGQIGSVYSTKQIERMNTDINGALNGKGYSVSEGSYKGYAVKFDLQFKEGGNQFAMEAKLGADKIEGNSISNTLQQSNDRQFSRFKETDNGDGTVSVGGGFAVDHKQIVMNSPQDTKHNKIHEIFHTLFFDNDNAKDGIGSYKDPQMPDQNDINTMINNSAMPKVEVKKPEDEKN